MKWTVIIPTIWKSEYTLNLLEKYQNSEWVSEIILINNAPSLTPSNFEKRSKIVHHKTENIYVNPSWNIGVEMSKNENILISNDDVIFDVDSALKYVDSLEGYTAIGVNPETYKSKPNEFGLINGHFIGEGWGCLLFVKKSLWKPIPNFLKIWYGDDWIARTNINIKSMMYKGGVETRMSSSTQSGDFNDIIRQDISNWNTLKRKKSI